MSSNYTGTPTATQAPGSAPAAGVVPIISLPQDTDGSTTANWYQAHKESADYIAWLMTSGYGAGMFGDGSDGSYTLDGVQAAVAGLFSKSSNTYTLLRDAYFLNLTVTGAGVVLKPNGFRVFVKGTLTTASSGSISADGNTGSGITGGVATWSTGTLGSGSAGGNGSTSNPGGAGGNLTICYGGAGGAGGASTIPNAGGAAGTVTAPVASLGSPRSYSPSTVGALSGNNGGSNQVVYFTGGTGGGAGGGTAGGGGSGGGGGGGVLAICARQVSLAAAGDIHAAGAQGNAFSVSGGGTGGGGGGGVLLIAYAYKNAVTFSAATNCPGGSAQAATGGGVTGSNGSNGTVFEIVVG